MNSLAEQILVDIFSDQLALKDKHCFIMDQNANIELDSSLYVAVGMKDSDYISSCVEYFYEGGIFKERQQVAMLENIQVDIFSKSKAAVLRRWEILAAIVSTYCKQKQEENGFKIFKAPNRLINTSSAEGSAFINRFTVVIPCHVWYAKEALTDYYNDFSARVDDEKTIDTAQGIIEFEITENQ